MRLIRIAWPDGRQIDAKTRPVPSEQLVHRLPGDASDCIPDGVFDSTPCIQAAPHVIFDVEQVVPDRAPSAPPAMYFGFGPANE